MIRTPGFQFRIGHDQDDQIEVEAEQTRESWQHFRAGEIIFKLKIYGAGETCRGGIFTRELSQTTVVLMADAALACAITNCENYTVQGNRGDHFRLRRLPMKIAKTNPQPPQRYRWTSNGQPYIADGNEIDQSVDTLRAFAFAIYRLLDLPIPVLVATQPTTPPAAPPVQLSDRARAWVKKLRERTDGEPQPAAVSNAEKYGAEPEAKQVARILKQMTEGKPPNENQ